MRRKGPGQKGTFSELELSIAKKYLQPISRRRMLVVGAIAAALVLGLVLFDQIALHGQLVSNGPLSSSHAGFESDCTNCHAEAARQVTDGSCSVCHEKYGDELGVFTFASHYLYRSDDFRRLVPSEHESPCFSCHVEHEGRQAVITQVPDSKCQTCHPFGSFNQDHPQFDFATEGMAEDAYLHFPHIHHVREVMKREQLEDLERACLYCHNAQPDGRSFDPISFDRHCDACHLQSTTATPALPVRQGGRDGPVGVETLEALVERRGSGVRWAFYTNPREFRRRGSSVSKAPVYHRDPWILENLRSLRQQLYPDAGLADLLTASADVAPRNLRELYEEAIATLEEQVIGLRGRPEADIQTELERINAVLVGLKRQIQDPFAPLDETKFLLALEGPSAELEADQIVETEVLVSDLTQPCQVCHLVRNATISRVQKDQRVLHRAEFDHRAHIVQLRCLDCHVQIPIAELAASSDKVEKGIDRAAIQNLPTLETCQQCHTPKLASNRCVTCHYFHPDKSRRSDLLLYLE